MPDIGLTSVTLHLKKVKVYARPLLLLSAILACPGQSSVFRLMPKLAGGYGGGGSIKTTLYDPCFRSTTVVQGFPAVNSFLYRKSRNSLPVTVSGCIRAAPRHGFKGGV